MHARPGTLRRRSVPLALALGALLALAAPGRAQGVGEATDRDTNVGYIDPAPLLNTLRFRFDAAYGNNRPSRAEFFYPRSGPGNPGPPLIETSVDYQEIRAYAEALLAPRLSAFVEVPVRFFNGEVNANTAGLSDINAGFRFALWADPDTAATFQFRTYAPTGDADRGLGTNHVSLEPALLLLRRLGEAWALEGEFRVWVPVGGTDFAGNILRAGVGLSYTIPCGDSWRLAPVLEFVGWTVLDGKETAAPTPFVSAVQSAAGDTIVNVKGGLRVGLGDAGSLYLGYGRPLTGEVWYENTWRVELRITY
jgi:hypothetical protein